MCFDVCYCYDLHFFFSADSVILALSFLSVVLFLLVNAFLVMTSVSPIFVSAQGRLVNIFMCCTITTYRCSVLLITSFILFDVFVVRMNTIFFSLLPSPPSHMSVDGHWLFNITFWVPYLAPSHIFFQSLLHPSIIHPSLASQVHRFKKLGHN